MSNLSEVAGLEHGVAKKSAVNDRGALRQELIDGLTFRTARPVPHEDGYLTEVLRKSWPEVEHEVVQVHLTTTFPGRVRAWGLHRHSWDRLHVVHGLLSIVCFDARKESPTFGAVNEFRVSDHNPGLLTIPPNVFHGWKNIGVDDASVINMPTVLYNHEQPDAVDIPYESELAEQVVPWRWW
jgi:dTDP-4-dehydrorhamnose 3,5-epimerase